MSQVGVRTRQQRIDDSARAFTFVIEELFLSKMDGTIALCLLEANEQILDARSILNMTEEDINDLHYFKEQIIKSEVKGEDDIVTTTRVNAVSGHKGMIRLLKDYITYKDQSGDPPNNDWSNIDPEEFNRFRFHSPVEVSTPAPSSPVELRAAV